MKIRRSPYHYLKIAVLLLLFGITAYSCNIKDNQPVSNTNTMAEKEKIKKILTEMWAAIEIEDMEKYASFIHPDFTQFGETDTVLRVGKEAEVKGITEWVASSDGIHTEMIDPLVTIKGNVAWITYYWSDYGTTDGEKFSSKGKSTRIFLKENGKWLCIHGHYTLLPDH